MLRSDKLGCLQEFKVPFIDLLGRRAKHVPEQPVGDIDVCLTVGGGGDVFEDGTEVFGKATEAAEGEFEPGDGAVEFVLVLGDVGSGEEGIYAVQEFVDGDLVDAGGAGFAFDASVHIGAYEP